MSLPVEVCEEVGVVAGLVGAVGIAWLGVCLLEDGVFHVDVILKPEGLANTVGAGLVGSVLRDDVADCIPSELLFLRRASVLQWAGLTRFCESEWIVVFLLLRFDVADVAEGSTWSYSY